MHEYVFLHLEIYSCLKRVRPDAFSFHQASNTTKILLGFIQVYKMTQAIYVNFVICSSQGHTQMHPLFRGFTVNE